jgi:uncharacterized protein (DUF362 family)
LKNNVLVLRSDENSLYTNFEKIFDFFPRLIDEKVKKIAIKLNLCAIKLPETGAISSPIVVEQLLKFLRKKYDNNIKISLIESDAPLNRNVSYVYNLLGFRDLAKKYGAKCVNLSKDQMLEKTIDGYFFRKVRVPKTLVDADFFISLPKLKTHYITKISCGLKNQFGCLPHKKKTDFHGMYHENLEKVIVDANLIRKPDFTLVDGIVGMGGPGSLGGLTKRYNLLLAGNDVVAVDCVCARIFGFNPYFIRHVRMAAHKKIGSMKYNICGVKIDDIRLKPDFNKVVFYYEKFSRLIEQL